MAKQMMDIGVDSNGDLLAAGGDWTVVESTAEHQRSLLLDAPGEYKFSPLTCVGIVQFEDDENPGDIVRAITQQFMRDGMEVVSLVPNPASVSDSTERPFVGAFYQ